MNLNRTSPAAGMQMTTWALENMAIRDRLSPPTTGIRLALRRRSKQIATTKSLHRQKNNLATKKRMGPTESPSALHAESSVHLLNTKQNPLDTQVGRFNMLRFEKNWKHRPRDNRVSGMTSDLGLTGMDMPLLTS
jgi:hypothetical protein